MNAHINERLLEFSHNFFSDGTEGVFIVVIYQSLGVEGLVLATDSPIDMHIGYNTRRIHCATRLSVNTDAEGECRASAEQMQSRYNYGEGRRGERNREGKHARADTAFGCLQRIAIPRSLFPFVVAPSNVSRIRAPVEKRGR